MRFCPLGVRLLATLVAAGIVARGRAVESAGPVLFRETFDQCADGQPPPAPWEVLEGRAVVERGRLHITSGKQNPCVLLRREFAGDVSVRVRLSGAPACHWSGMVVHRDYWLTVNQEHSSLLLHRRLQRVSSGVSPEAAAAQLGAAPAWQQYLWDPDEMVMRLDVAGGFVRAYLDGKRFIDVREDRVPDAGTVMLVGGWGTDICVDEVTVVRFAPDLEPPAEPVLPKPALDGLAAVLDRQDAVYADGDTVALTVRWQARNAERLRLRFALLDLDQKPAGVAEAEAGQEPGQAATVTVALQPPRRGVFKVALALVHPDGREAPQGDLTSFSVVPLSLAERPASVGSGFGGHPHWEVPEFHYALARKIGMRWARDHDAIQYTWWRNVEPERGAWRWYDEDLARLSRNRLHLLGEFLYCPTWAGTDGSAVKPPRNLDDFATYVRTTVGHYRASIRGWEVWNEPHFSGFWQGTPEQYVELLRTASTAAKSADPDCLVIGGGGVDLGASAWLERAMKAGLLQHCDRFSIHYGAAGKATEKERCQFVERLARLRELMRQHGGEKPIWNTEVAVMTTSFLDPYRVGFAEADAVYHCREAAYALVRLYVLNLACGIEKVFYYDLVWPRRDGFIEGFLREPVHTRMLELHGGLKPCGVAYATAADILDGARFVTTVGLASDVHVYLFQREAQCLAVYWGNFGRTWAEKRIRLAAGGVWELSDVMNVRQALPALGPYLLPLTRAPVFALATGMSGDAFERAWCAATVIESGGQAVRGEARGR